MKDFETILQGYMTRRQVKTLIEQLIKEGYILKSGQGSGTYYTVSPQYIERKTMMIEAVGIGLKTIQEKRQNVQDLSKEGEEKDTF